MDPAPGLEWRADAGGVVGPGGFGVVDLGVRTGPWSAELFTDTLDARWQPSSRGGRAWVGVRAAAGSAGFLPFRWADGRRDRGQDLGAGYAGPDAGLVRYGPDGTYAGLGGALRTWWFFPVRDTFRDVPGVRPVGTADAIAGSWRRAAHAEVRGGLDASPGVPPSPHVRLDAGAAAPPEAAFATPVLEVRGQWARATDEVTAMRLGGTSPYVLPLAGLAVAEHLVERGIAVRAGLAAGPGGARLSTFVDVASFVAPGASGSTEVAGLGASLRVARGAWFAETSAGASPWAERSPGSAWGAWIRLGTDWR